MSRRGEARSGCSSGLQTRLCLSRPRRSGAGTCGRSTVGQRWVGTQENLKQHFFPLKTTKSKVGGEGQAGEHINSDGLLATRLPTDVQDSNAAPVTLSGRKKR